MKIVSIILILILSISCKEKESKTIEKSINSSTVNEISTDKKVELDSNSTESVNEVMLEKNILFNGKLNRYFTIAEFENIFGKTDSIKLMSQEESCSYIFDNEDSSKASDDKYFYKNGSRYENHKDKVAVDEFRFLKGNFILYKGNKLNSTTTISQLQKFFPVAIKNIETLDVSNEGKLQTIQLREDSNNVSDGHIKIFFKSGKLYYMHWWFPC